MYKVYGILAQLGEHLPYKQRVTGSSPVGPIFEGEILQDAAVAELADAQDLKSCGGDIVPVRFRSAALRFLPVIDSNHGFFLFSIIFQCVISAIVLYL